jgi:DNA repair protein RadA/Sms
LFLKEACDYNLTQASFFCLFFKLNLNIKMKTKYVCQNCSYQSPNWLGQCPECMAWGTLEEEVVAETYGKSGKNKNVLKGSISSPITLDKVELKKTDRISSGLVELDRVLGGIQNEQGFVKGQAILLGGEPGIGKSTIALEVVFKAVSQNIRSLYVSGEESAAQILLRARRIKNNQIGLDQIEVLSEYNVEKILYNLEQKKYDLVVIDSIQTMYSEDSVSLAGTMSQVKICASKLVNYAKNNDVILILIGQVTKEGNFAGPKLLEHMVDTVLYMEGDPDTGLRILKAVKNRFGSSNEVGIFEMTEKGLSDVVNYASLFLDDDVKDEIGVCKSVVIEGNRFFLVQVQALVDPTPYGLPKRVAEGISISRLQRICAIVSKYLKINLRASDVYLKIAGGMRFEDPALDLAVAVAILSSVKGVSVSSELVAFGELNLTGTVSKVLRTKERVSEAKRLGYKKYLSNENVGALREIEKSIKR